MRSIGTPPPHLYLLGPVGLWTSRIGPCRKLDWLGEKVDLRLARAMSGCTLRSFSGRRPLSADPTYLPPSVHIGIRGRFAVRAVGSPAFRFGRLLFHVARGVPGEPVHSWGNADFGERGGGGAMLLIPVGGVFKLESCLERLAVVSMSALSVLRNSSGQLSYVG